MEAALRETAAHGVTSVQNLADAKTDQPEIFREFQKYERNGKLHGRIYEAIQVHDWKMLADPASSPFGSAPYASAISKPSPTAQRGPGSRVDGRPFASNPANSGLASPDLRRRNVLRRDSSADKAGLQLT